MTFYVLFAVICFAVSSTAYPSPKDTAKSFSFPYVTREEWGGRPPTGVTPMNTPVQFVVIHHSYVPGVCMTSAQCARDMRSMQDFHQLTNGWTDIGYSFAVGGEGSVFEGRGWQATGAHAVGYNANSIGIVLIGDWVSNLPPQAQIQSAKELIAAGVELGYIRPDYQLIGHRQVSATECPGQRLFAEISTWDRFTANL